jgi:predicted DNA-binding antitoxin AbrB/MazE fold protein
MTATIHAFFENGRFRPVEPVGLPERSLVEIEVRTSDEREIVLSMSEGLAKVYSILGERYNSGVTDTAARHNEIDNDS